MLSMVDAFRVSLVTLKDVRDEVRERLASLSVAHMDCGEYDSRVGELNLILNGIDRQIAKYERWLNEETCANARSESRG